MDLDIDISFADAGCQHAQQQLRAYIQERYEAATKGKSSYATKACTAEMLAGDRARLSGLIEFATVALLCKDAVDPVAKAMDAYQQGAKLILDRERAQDRQRAETEQKRKRKAQQVQQPPLASEPRKPAKRFRK